MIKCPLHDTGAGPCYCQHRASAPAQDSLPIESDPIDPSADTVLYPMGHSSFHVKWRGDYIGTVQGHDHWWLATYKGRRGGVELSYSKPCFDSREEAIEYLQTTWTHICRIFGEEM